MNCALCGDDVGAAESVKPVPGSDFTLHPECTVEWAHTLADSTLYAMPTDKREQQVRKRWIVNKLKGAVAEQCCALHFQALGYSMQPLGLENIASRHLQTQSERMTVRSRKTRSPVEKQDPTFVRSELSILPDFLASRYVPRRTSGDDPIVDAFMVEVKYRAKVDLEEFAKSQLYVENRYAKLIDRGGHIAFYVVTGSATESGAVRDGFLFVNRSWKKGWAKPSDLSDDHRFHGERACDDFGTIYDDAVREALSVVLALGDGGQINEPDA